MCVIRRRVRYIDGKPAIISDDYFDEYGQATGNPAAEDHSGPLSRSAAVASMTAAVVPCTP
jgi:hypothetical protein